MKPNGFEDITIDRPLAVHEQIRKQVRDLIVSSEFPENTRLPSTQELAKMWGTHPSVVHTALTPLAKEGWLKRVPRVGTFVTRPDRRLTRVGLYVRSESMMSGAYAFQGALLQELKHLLREQDVELSIWTDPRPLDEQHETWEALRKGILNRKIQALIVTSTDWPHLNWLLGLPIPSAFLSSGNIPARVVYDQPQFADLALHSLADRGCRSAGLIAAACPSFSNPDGSTHFMTHFYQHFVEKAGELGLEIRDDWIRCSQQDIMPIAEHEQFGYERFRELWTSPAGRPDGLIVWPDTVVKGVLLGLKEHSVRVPDELRLVFHRNQRVPTHCPVTATFVESDERKIAEALLRQIRRQIEGRAPEPIMVPYRAMT
jgi:DNA-binding LacI/PurR family transcriptional regulator